jgi:hypothetical protein
VASPRAFACTTSLSWAGMGLALASSVVFAWIASYWSAVPLFQAAFPGEVAGYFSDGPPKWRAASGVAVQMTLLVLFVLAYDAHGRSLQRWSAAWTRDRKCSWTWMFVGVFPSWLLLDYALLHLRPLMHKHHLLCLVGHLAGCLVWPDGLPFYFSGVVALELGSAACNIHCIYGPQSLSSALVYSIGLTLTHLVMCTSVRDWARHTHANKLAKLWVVATMVVLAALRQREWLNAMRADAALPM